MAKKPSQFDLLKQSGVIKDYSTSSVSILVKDAKYLKTNNGRTLPSSQDRDPAKINSTVYNDQKRKILSETDRDVAEVVKEQRGINRTYFNHHENSPLINYSENLSDTRSSKNLSVPGNFLSNLTQYEIEMKDSLDNYFTSIATKFRKIEDDNAKDRALINPILATRDGWINFFKNKTTSTNTAQLNVLNYFDKVVSLYTDFANKDITRQQQDAQKLQQDLGNLFSKIDSLLLAQMGANQQQFWPLYLTIKGDVLRFIETIDPNSNINQIFTANDLDQLKKSGTTINELIEQVLLLEAFTKLASEKNSNIESVEVLGIGSSKANTFNEFIEDNNLSNILTQSQIEQYLRDYMDANIGLNIKIPGITFYQKTAQTSSGKIKGKKEDNVSDFRVQIKLKQDVVKAGDSGLRSYDINAKISSEGRYVESSEVGGSLGKLSLESDTNTSSESFSKYLKFYAIDLLASYIKGDSLDLVYQKTGLIRRLFISGSNKFKSKYGLEIEKKQNSDLLIIGADYIFFSDFLLGLKTFLLSATSKTSGSMSKAIDGYLNNIGNTNSYTNLMSQVKDMSDLKDNPEFNKLQEKLLSNLKLLKVSYKVDISNFVSRFL